MTSETDPFTLLLPEGEEPNEWNDKLASIGHLTLEYYKGDVNAIAPDQINPHHTNIILSPALGNPVDQVEALKPLVEQSSCELGRIISVVHCDQIEAHKQLGAWYDACIHFSDVCLINRGAATTNKFVQDFIDHYKENHIPCLFELVFKKGLKNPGLVLEAQARRISLYFEPDEDQWLDDEDEDFESQEEDPYMIKLPSGIREKWIPDIRAILGA
jgi:hypothetical protein